MTVNPSWVRRPLKGLALTLGLSLLLLNLAVLPATAATVCDPGGDTCVVVPDTIQTPLGLVTVTITATNGAIVHLSPTAPTLVFGVPFAVPPGPPGIPGYQRSSLQTAAGVINIDMILIPPGPPGRASLPNIAVISMVPPGPPCRATTTGTTVIFTPILPPAPPT